MKHAKTVLMTAAAGLLILTQCTRTGNSSLRESCPHYDIDVHIDPATRSIEVSGEISGPAEAFVSDSMFFYLQKDMKIENIHANGQVIAVTNTAPSDIRYMPHAEKLYIDTNTLARSSGPVSLSFSYKGTLSRMPAFFANTIDTTWTELGLYYPWFPYNPEKIRLFTFTVRVTADPGYTVFGIGDISRSSTVTEITAPAPTTDIVVCLSKDVKTYTAGGKNPLYIFHHTLTEPVLRRMAEDVEAARNLYSSWYGLKNTGITLIETRRPSGGGYARVGGVVLQGIDPDRFFSRLEGYNRYFAHETAHLWWFKATTTTWEDWLNESLAEYSALRVLRERFGPDTYTSWLDNKKETIAGTPPIWNFDRNSADYKTVVKVIYNKGPVLLSELEQKTGSDNFNAFCKQLIKDDVRTTEGFLTALARAQDTETAEWFGHMLKTR